MSEVIEQIRAARAVFAALERDLNTLADGLESHPVIESDEVLGVDLIDFAKTATEMATAADALHQHVELWQSTVVALEE